MTGFRVQHPRIRRSTSPDRAFSFRRIPRSRSSGLRIHDDLETPYSRTKHGSALIRVHAIVYNADLDEIHNTIDTDESDEAICNLTSSVDTSFIELSLTDGRAAAAVALLAIPSRSQYVEPSTVIYRVLPR